MLEKKCDFYSTLFVFDSQGPYTSIISDPSSRSTDSKPTPLIDLRLKHFHLHMLLVSVNLSLKSDSGDA